MLDPAKLSSNHLSRALTELSSVDRQGILTVDVTDVFAPAMSGMTFPTVRAEMGELGQHYPLPDPAPNSEGGISFPYEVLRRVPGNKFRPHDEVVAMFNVGINGKIQVTSATWLNTTAASIMGNLSLKGKH